MMQEENPMPEWERRELEKDRKRTEAELELKRKNAEETLKKYQAELERLEKQKREREASEHRLNQLAVQTTRIAEAGDRLNSLADRAASKGINWADREERLRVWKELEGMRRELDGVAREGQRKGIPSSRKLELALRIDSSRIKAQRKEITPQDAQNIFIRVAKETKQDIRELQKKKDEQNRKTAVPANPELGSMIATTQRLVRHWRETHAALSRQAPPKPETASKPSAPKEKRVKPPKLGQQFDFNTRYKEARMLNIAGITPKELKHAQELAHAPGYRERLSKWTDFDPLSILHTHPEKVRSFLTDVAHVLSPPKQATETTGRPPRLPRNDEAVPISREETALQTLLRELYGKKALGGKGVSIRTLRSHMSSKVGGEMADRAFELARKRGLITSNKSGQMGDMITITRGSVQQVEGMIGGTRKGSIGHAGLHPKPQPEHQIPPEAGRLLDKVGRLVGLHEAAASGHVSKTQQKRIARKAMRKQLPRRPR